VLDSCDRIEIVPAWGEILSQAVLPVSEAEFFSKQGPTPLMPDSRRGFHRMYLRTSVVLQYENQFHAAYLLDISRSGVGLISPVQLLPSAPIELWLPDGRHMELQTKRCVRCAERCYQCGGEFTCSTSR
jgi:hypothetical protein